MPGADRIRAVPAETRTEECARAYLILKYAHETCDALAQAFRTVRAKRAEETGTPVRNTTDEDQDLLRAMLVFACAGLDSMLKQLIRDALPRLAAVPDSSSRSALAKFVRRKLGGSDAEEVVAIDREFLSAILLSECTVSGCIEALIQEKTGRSLQSREQIEDVLPHLGVSNSLMDPHRNDLRTALNNRNQIIHEMDIDFGQARRNRFPRPIGRSFAEANLVLSLAEEILRAVDAEAAALPRQ